eukprot:4986986-Pyramimonas_sp.AAC.1
MAGADAGPPSGGQSFGSQALGGQADLLAALQRVEETRPVARHSDRLQCPLRDSEGRGAPQAAPRRPPNLGPRPMALNPSAGVVSERGVYAGHGAGRG